MSPMFDTWANHGFVAIETKKTHGQHEDSITEEATPYWLERIVKTPQANHEKAEARSCV